MCSRPWRLDEADDDVCAALVTSPALVEHGPGLADAGHSSEVDAELARRLDALIDFLGSVVSPESLPIVGPTVRPYHPAPAEQPTAFRPRTLHSGPETGLRDIHGTVLLHLGEGPVLLEDVDVVGGEESELGGLGLAGDETCPGPRARARGFGHHGRLGVRVGGGDVRV